MKRKRFAMYLHQNFRVSSFILRIWLEESYPLKKLIEQMLTKVALSMEIFHDKKWLLNVNS